MRTKEYLKWIMPSVKNRSVPINEKDEQFNFRIEKAKEQRNLSKVAKEKIIDYVNEFLELIMGMEKVDNPIIYPKKCQIRRIKYAEINPGNKEDIVWIKFTKSGYISVIGVGCDIHFTDYAREHTTAGRIIKNLGEEWEDSFVLIFPLKDIPQGLGRSDIESGIGNYLISKGVPILDFYSHNY